VEVLRDSGYGKLKTAKKLEEVQTFEKQHWFLQKQSTEEIKYEIKYRPRIHFLNLS
jgi:hypothetical protein